MKKKMKVEYSPLFLEHLSKLSPEERAELMQALDGFVEKMNGNPYVGTPMWGGWLNPIIVFTNWIKRMLWDLGIKIGGHHD